MALGAERSSIGYPTSDEYPVAGGRRTDFDRGAIVWTARTGTTAATNTAVTNTAVTNTAVTNTGVTNQVRAR